MEDTRTLIHIIFVKFFCLSFFPFSMFLKFFSNAVHYWWRDDHFSSLLRCREKSLQSVQLALLPTSLSWIDWFYNFSTSTMFSLVDLDLAVNAYPVHLIRLCSPCVFQRYYVWNWLVQSNYIVMTAAGVRTDPTLDRFYSALIRYERRRRASRRRAFIRTGFNRL